MAIGGAFLGGGVEVVPAGSCKLELEILTEDRANLTATFTIKGTSTYTVTAGADGRAVYTVPSGQTYTVSVNTTGYDNIASQTVVAESGTVRYVRFEAFAGRVKRSGDTMDGNLTIAKSTPALYLNAINSSKRSDIEFRGNDNRVGILRMYENHEDSGYNYGFLGLFKPGGAIVYNIKLGFDENGAPYNMGLTPSDKADNTDRIATTAWVNQTNALVHSFGNETISGEKTFTGVTIFNYGNGTQYDTELSTSQAISVISAYGNTGNFAVYRNPDSTSMRFNLRNKSGTWKQIDFYNKDDNTAYVTIPPTPANATGNEIATANWSIGKFVQKSGDTMTGDLIRKSTQYENNDFVQTRHVLGEYEFADKNGVFSGYLRRVGSTATQYTQMGCVAKINDATVSSSIEAHILPDGKAYANAPSWSVGTNDNSDKILTIAMANGLPSLVHTDRDETIQGNKTFKSRLVNKKSWDMGMEMISEGFNRGNTYSAYVRPVQFICRDVNGDTTFVLQQYAESNDRRGLDLTMYDKSGNAVTLGIKSNVTFRYATAPTTPSIATSNEIATADWVIGKVAQRNKVTNVTSYAQLMDLIKSGKQGDSFGITMDYTGGSLGGITATNRSVHAFGHYTIDEITVSGGALTGLQAFGSGEVSGALKDNDSTTYTYATTGFGRQAIGNGVLDAFRVVEDGKLSYFAPNDDSASISAFEGYYISI